MARLQRIYARFPGRANRDRVCGELTADLDGLAVVGIPVHLGAYQVDLCGPPCLAWLLDDQFVADARMSATAGVGQ